MLDFTSATQRLDVPPASAPFALREFLNGFFYYRRVALIVFGAIVAIGTIGALAMPATYSAEARLLPLSTGIYDMQDAGTVTPPGQVLDPAAVANVELQMLDSLELHRAVVAAQLGPGASSADVDAALEKFRAALHVTKANDANVIELTLIGRDPVRAADTLRELIRRYFETRANVLTAGRVTFLEQQRDAVKRQLDDANAQITRFQKDNGIVDIAAQVAGAVAQDDLLRKNKLDTDAQLADGRRSLSTLRTQAGGIPTNIELYSDNTEAARALGEMQATLLTLQAKRADVASRFLKTAPQVTQLDKQIAALQATITQQKSSLVTTRRTGRNQSFDTTHDKLVESQVVLAGAEARARELAQQMSASGARLDRLNAVADRLKAMTLDRDVLAENFKSLAAQVQRARVQLNQASAAGSPSVRVIEAPTPPAKRNNPPALFIAGSVVAGLLIAITTVFVLGSLRETFLSPVEAERALGVPVLATPSENGPPRDWHRLIAAIDAAPGPTTKAILLVAPTSKMSLQETALGVGRALVRRGHARVALVRFADGAPVPATLDAMALEMFEGMATGVIGTGACSNERLDAKLIAQLKIAYDYVVVTAPVIADGFEGVELSQSVDLVVPVLEAEATRRPVAQNLLTHLHDAGAAILGTVLLGRRSHIPERVYRLLIDRRLKVA